MTKRIREGLAALCMAAALLLIGATADMPAATVLGVIAGVLALGAIAVSLVRD